MMKSIIKMISVFFLLSLFTISGSQARMPPAGEYGILETVSINYKKERDWISMVAEQIITSSSMIKKPSQPPPPAPGASSSKTGLSDYWKSPKSPPPPPHPSPTIVHIIAKSPPPPPYPSPTKEHVSSTILKPWMSESDLGKVAKSPPPSPIIAPTKDDISSSSTGTNGRSLRSPPPRDIWVASTLIADC